MSLLFSGVVPIEIKFFACLYALGFQIAKCQLENTPVTVRVLFREEWIDLELK